MLLICNEELTGIVTVQFLDVNCSNLPKFQGTMSISLRNNKQTWKEELSPEIPSGFYPKNNGLSCALKTSVCLTHD